jgi:hypothetical protein
MERRRLLDQRDDCFACSDPGEAGVVLLSEGRARSVRSRSQSAACLRAPPHPDPVAQLVRHSL